MRIYRIAGAVALALLTACAAEQPSDDGAALAAQDEQWEQAVAAGDLDALVALYTDDARLMPPGAEAGEGAEAVRSAFSEMLSSGVRVDLETGATSAWGDTGYVVGTYTVRTADDTVVDRGSYIETFRRVDGEWRISNDIWNSEMDGEGAATTMIFTHQVEDPERWLAAWRGAEGRRADFAAHGASQVRVFQSGDDPARVALLVGAEDPEALAQFIASPEGAAAKAEDGVLDASLRSYSEVTE